MLLGSAPTGTGYNDHNTRKTLYLSRHGLRLEKETIDDTTQTIPLALIAIGAICHWDLEEPRDHFITISLSRVVSAL